MVATNAKDMANRRNSKHSTGPRDTSLTRWNSEKHGILSRQVTSVALDGEEGVEEFHRFAKQMWEDCAPSGALEELLVEELTTLGWRKRRLVSYERAVTSKQAEASVKDWEEHEPSVVRVKRFATQQANKGKTKETFQKLRPDILGPEAEQPSQKSVGPGRAFWEHAARMTIKPTDLPKPGLLFSLAIFRNLLEDDSLNSPLVRAEVLHLAANLGVDVDSALGSEAGSKLHTDCSPEEIEQVIEAACELNEFSRRDFWRSVANEVQRDIQSGIEQLEQVEVERQSARDLAALPDDATLGKIQRYEAHLTRQFTKALHELQRLQASRLTSRPRVPVAVDVDISTEEAD